MPHVLVGFLQHFAEGMWEAKKCSTRKFHGSVYTKFSNWGELFLKLVRRKPWHVSCTLSFCFTFDCLNSLLICCTCLSALLFGWAAISL